MDTKKIIIAIIVLALYFFLLPKFWPRPKVKVNIPEQLFTSEDLVIGVAIWTLHSNVALFSVDLILEVNPKHNFGNSVYSENLYRDSKKRLWNASHKRGVNRLSYPWIIRKKFTIPREELLAKRVAGKSSIKGRISVILTYPDLMDGSTSTREINSITQFACNLL